MELKTIALTKGLSKAGQPIYSAKMRNGLTEQLENKVLSVLTDLGATVEKRGICIPVGIDEETGDTIHYVLEGTLTVADVTQAKKSYARKKEVVEIDVPQLF